jgi:hypothetical protein
MKKQTGIWLDSSKAIVVTLSGTEENVKEIQSDIENRIHHDSEGDQGTFMGQHHLSQERKFDERKRHQIENYVKRIIESIRNDDELCVFGPSEIKLRLKSMIEEDKQISTRLKSVETSDKMTLNQVIAKVKDFYKN